MNNKGLGLVEILLIGIVLGLVIGFLFKIMGA